MPNSPITADDCQLLLQKIEKEYRKGLKLCRRRFLQEIEWLKSRRSTAVRDALPPEWFAKIRFENGAYSLSDTP